jgi:sigma-B regulation protein RsbU (phosphoserine phosphatase)
MRLERMTMALALLRFQRDAPDAWSLTVSSAAMPPVVVHRADGRLEEVTLQGLPLGAMDGAEYEGRRLELREGDCVLLMSDGLPELPSPNGEVYGYARVHERLRTVVGGGPRSAIEGLASEVESWTGGKPPADDVTFVVVRVSSDGPQDTGAAASSPGRAAD